MEERRLRVFENRVLRGIFGPKKYEVTGKWRRSRDEKFNDVYCSQNTFQVIRLGKMRWTGHVAGIGERRSAYRVLVGKPERKRPLRTPRPREKYNIKMELKGIIWGYVG
jgi:hypothetical protein